MHAVRWVLIAGLALAVSCGSDDTASPPSESEAPSEVSEVTESPSAEPTTAPSAEPTEGTEEAAPATTLFVTLPKGYGYADLPNNVRRQLAGQLGGIENDPIISDVATKYVERGSVPVAALIAVRFSDQATSADLNGFAQGVVRGAGGKSKPTQVGGEDVTYVQGQTSAFIYMGEDFALLFFGASRSDLEPVVAAVIKGVG